MTGLNQRVFGAALFAACGRGMTTPVLAAAPPLAGSRTVDDFLTLRRETMTCADIPANPAVDGLDDFQRSSRYLIQSIAVVWRIAGPAWTAVDVLLGAWFAICGVMAYLVSRQVMGPPWSAAVAGLFVLSPLQVGNLADVRDYAKAPWSLLAWWFVIRFALAPPPSTGRLVALAAAAGAIVGLGFGMRSDVAINLVLLLGTIALFLGEPLAQSWRRRTMAAAACLLSFMVVAAPLAGRQNSAGLGWHWALLGQAPPFDHALRIMPTPYEINDSYSDSVVATSVNAYAGRVEPTTAPVALGSVAYERASRRYYLETVRAFPADIAIRAIGAVARVLDLPYSAIRPYSSRRLARPLERILDWRTRVLALLDGSGLVVFVVVAGALAVKSRKTCAFLLFVVAFLGGYPSVQFQQRHLFHLEFVPLCLAGVVLSTAYRDRQMLSLRNWRAMARPAIAILLFAAVLVASMTTVRAFQQRSVATLFERYGAAAVIGADAAGAASADGMVRVATGDWLRPRPDPRPVASHMLVVDLSGARCGDRDVGLYLRYASRMPSDEFSRALDVELPPGPDPTRVFLPIFETGSSNPDPDLLAFSGLDVAASDAPCVVATGRLERPDAFPLLLTAIVRPGFRDQPLYQRLRGWERATMSARLGYWAPAELRNDRRWLADNDRAQAFGTAFAYLAPNVRLGSSGTITVGGIAQDAGSYLLSWKPRTLQASDTICLQGTLRRGGVTIGLEGRSGWVRRTSIDQPGDFEACLRPPAVGEYQLVIANNLIDGELKNDVDVERVRMIAGPGPERPGTTS